LSRHIWCRTDFGTDSGKPAETVPIMAVLHIIKAPDPMLKKHCDPVAAVDDEVRTLIDDMLESMYAAPGMGLSAPQVGVLRRIIVVDVAKLEGPRDPVRMVNPELVEISGDIVAYEEGCLSFPDQYAQVARPISIRVRYLDYDNEVREQAAEGLLATCIQHEMDHLDGVLFVDHLSGLKRDMILRKMVKQRKMRAATAA
jgi:peptide deformylase